MRYLAHGCRYAASATDATCCHASSRRFSHFVGSWHAHAGFYTLARYHISGSAPPLTSPSIPEAIASASNSLAAPGPTISNDNINHRTFRGSFFTDVDAFTSHGLNLSRRHYCHRPPTNSPAVRSTARKH